MMATVIIAGSSGALGSVVTATLREQHYNIIPFDHPDIDAANDGVVSSACAHLPSDTFACINLAGMFIGGKPVSAHEPNEVEALYRSNLLTTITLARRVLPNIARKPGASFITIGGRQALEPKADAAVYAAYKAGVIAFTKSIAVEGLHLGYRANVIVPSVIRTPENLAWSDGKVDSLWVTPESIAELIVYLLSESCPINGAVLQMYGGLV